MIKLSTKTRYGSSLMFHLARSYGRKPMRLKEVSEIENISIRYLEQIIIPLKTAGLVKSLRGAKGGYVLTTPPKDIALSDIILALEGPWTLVECTSDSDYCSRTEKCVFFEVWQKATQALTDIFENISLHDLVEKNKRLAAEREIKSKLKQRWTQEFFKGEK